MTEGYVPSRRHDTKVLHVLVSWCLVGFVLLASCSRGDDAARDTQTPEATAFVATATVPGIAGPPLTPQATEPPRDRTRAESFLRRMAPTDADLPPGFGKPDAGFKDSAQLAGVASDPGTAKDQWDRAGLVLAYESGFESGSGGSSPTDGTVRAVMHTGYAFATPEGAGAWLDEAAGELEPAARALIDGQGGDIRAEQITDLSLGDEAVAWRASGPSEAVGWVIAVRRGAGGFLLTLDGSGPAVDRVARDLGVRLDQRMAAAMP